MMRFDWFRNIRWLDILIVGVLVYFLVYHPNVISASKSKSTSKTFFTEPFSSSDHGWWYMYGAMPWNGWNYGTAEEYDL